MRDTEAQNAHDGRTVGRRIRFLRGDLSQAAFAKKVGISRAALANYETGRTIPNDKIISEISIACEISIDFLKDGKVSNIEELAVSIGVGSNSNESISPDEWSVVRLLRVCDDETIRTVLTALVYGFSRNRDAKDSADTFALLDLARLLTIIDGRGEYIRGLGQANLGPVLEALRKRLDKLSQ